jgi:hypothetical protein
MQHQTVLSSKSEADLDRANVHVRSNSGEELRMRELRTGDGWTAIGIRHDLPDDLGRVWRTECVLKRASAEGGQDLVRLRTQCTATTPGARLDTPREPYLIKALLKNGWGEEDQQFSVTDQPVWLENSDAGPASAKLVTLGDAAKLLPTVYVSATGVSSWLLSQREIEKLSYDLGGIAHVVVEPARASRSSFATALLRKACLGFTLGVQRHSWAACPRRRPLATAPWTGPPTTPRCVSAGR